MNAVSFGAAAHERPGIISDEPKSDKPSEPAWIVPEAANELGDDATVAACRRVIDANLNGSLPPNPTCTSSSIIPGEYRPDCPGFEVGHLRHRAPPAQRVLHSRRRAPRGDHLRGHVGHQGGISGKSAGERQRQAVKIGSPTSRLAQVSRLC